MEKAELLVAQIHSENSGKNHFMKPLFIALAAASAAGSLPVAVFAAGAGGFFWVMVCLLDILVVFSACYTSAKSVGGYTLAVTAFVLLLMTYAHEKRWRKYITWPLIGYSFYSILVSSFTFYQSFADKARYVELGGAYTIVLYAASNIPYIFCLIAILTTGAWWFYIYRTKRSENRLMKIVFAANLIIYVITSLR